MTSKAVSAVYARHASALAKQAAENRAIAARMPLDYKSLYAPLTGTDAWDDAELSKVLEKLFGH